MRLLAQTGSRVVLTYRSSPDRAQELVDAFENVTALPLDTADVAASKTLVDQVAETSIQTLIFAAGPPVPQIHLSRVQPDDFAKALAAETAGFFNVVQPALPHLRASKGSIVAVTTAATDRYAVRDGLSAGPKAAIEALVRGIAAEEGRFGVRANSVGPGMLRDGMAEALTAGGSLRRTGARSRNQQHCNASVRELRRCRRGHLFLGIRSSELHLGTITERRRRLRSVAG